MNNRQAACFVGKTASLRVSSSPGRHSTRWELWYLEKAGDTEDYGKEEMEWVANNMRRFNGHDIQDDEGWEADYDTCTTRNFSADSQTSTDVALAQEKSTIYVNRTGPPTKQDGPDWSGKYYEGWQIFNNLISKFQLLDSLLQRARRNERSTVSPTL